jgi:phosphopentomutase
MAESPGAIMSMNRSRVVWIVLDGVGLEALPDAGSYGDGNSATLPHVAAACNGLRLPNLQRLGLGNLADVAGAPPVISPVGAYGRLAEISPGKDSIIGHWELSGLILDQPFSTYPQGFPAPLVDSFAAAAGSQPLGNIPAGGISVLREYGAEHVRTGRPILYTSVDSVLQIAAHEEVLPLDRLYELCRVARELADEYNIARVIARPFVGNEKEGFRRTPSRKDFPVPPPRPTLLERLTEKGCPVTAVGKISDLFAGRGISKSIATLDNNDGMEKTLTELSGLEPGLLMVNLIDFDTAYGHRGDAEGFGRALEEFDQWLPELYDAMLPEDLLVICADHGCDPTTPGTDHTREYVPVLVWSELMPMGVDLGDRRSFADVGATLAEYFSLSGPVEGSSFLGMLGLP